VFLPTPQVFLVQRLGLHGDNSGRISYLSPGRRNAIPEERVQNDILSGGDPRSFAKQLDPRTTPEHFLIGCVRSCAVSRNPRDPTTTDCGPKQVQREPARDYSAIRRIFNSLRISPYQRRLGY
jgi:hypothetical protein